MARVPCVHFVVEYVSEKSQNKIPTWYTLQPQFRLDPLRTAVPFWEQPPKFQVVCPQNETAVLKGLKYVDVKKTPAYRLTVLTGRVPEGLLVLRWQILVFGMRVRRLNEHAGLLEGGLKRID